MNAGAKLGLYGLLLAAVLGGGAVVGAATGPIDVGDEGGHGDGGHAGGRGGPGELPAGGLMVSQDGYTFAPEDRLADAGPFAFSIVGPDGHALEAYEELHERELHLIVASRDLRQFAHVHPDRTAGGRWTIDLPTLPPGAYRAFADFAPAGGEQLTLGVDLVAPGAVRAPAPLLPSTSDSVGDYDVSLEGEIEAASESEVTVTVRRGGQVVTTDSYLGAGGHLVALRDGDLAYLHVHPLDGEPAGPVRFAVEVPSPGTYALFFDFLHAGEVRTARFVVEVPTAQA